MKKYISLTRLLMAKMFAVLAIIILSSATLSAKCLFVFQGKTYVFTNSGVSCALLQSYLGNIIFCEDLDRSDPSGYAIIRTSLNKVTIVLKDGHCYQLASDKAQKNMEYLFAKGDKEAFKTFKYQVGKISDARIKGITAALCDKPINGKTISNGTHEYVSDKGEKLQLTVYNGNVISKKIFDASGREVMLYDKTLASKTVLCIICTYYPQPIGVICDWRYCNDADFINLAIGSR